MKGKFIIGALAALLAGGGAAAAETVLQNPPVPEIKAVAIATSDAQAQQLLDALQAKLNKIVERNYFASANVSAATALRVLETAQDMGVMAVAIGAGVPIDAAVSKKLKEMTEQGVEILGATVGK